MSRGFASEILQRWQVWLKKSLKKNLVFLNSLRLEISSPLKSRKPPEEMRKPRDTRAMHDGKPTTEETPMSERTN
jgi:hypothetical protein